MTSFIRGLLNALVAEAKRVVGPTWELEIVQQDGNRLVLKNNSRQFVFNSRFRTVKSATEVLAQFDAIETIDVKHHHGGDDEPESWSISLNLKGRLPSVVIGDTTDDVDASIIAARICTFTGKKVRAL